MNSSIVAVDVVDDFDGDIRYDVAVWSKCVD